MVASTGLPPATVRTLGTNAPLVPYNAFQWLPDADTPSTAKFLGTWGNNGEDSLEHGSDVDGDNGWGTGGGWGTGSGWGAGDGWGWGAGGAPWPRPPISRRTAALRFSAQVHRRAKVMRPPMHWKQMERFFQLPWGKRLLVWRTVVGEALDRAL